MNNKNPSIQDVLEKVDIVELINGYVKLERSGSNYFGLCPFHDDNNPSMSVSPEKKIFKCFSCNASGDAIEFVRRIENIPFNMALKKVASTAGIDVKIYENPKEQKLAKYYDIMNKATSFYKFSLRNTKNGENALKYLYDRNLSSDIINRFDIGFSPSEGDLLYQALTKEDVLAIDMLEIGLIGSGNNYYDIFRNRIMFPIEDLNGRIVAFSGRVYSKDSQHKYVNSRENIIFRKSNILYNYHRASNEIRKQDFVYVFEGFMDVIAAYRANIFNAVATMGTALTVEQIKAIKTLTNNVVIAYDGDNAGIEASKRAIGLFTSYGLDVKVVLLPDQLDPDDYINKYGEEALYKFFNENQKNSLDFIYDVEKKELDINDPYSIERFKNSIFGQLSNFNSNVLTEIYLNKMSEDLNISTESLMSDFAKIPTFKPALKRVTKRPRKSYSLDSYVKSERFLVVIAFNDKQDCLRIREQLDSYYVNKEQRDLLYKLYDYYRSYDVMDEEIFKTNLTDDQISLIEDILTISDVEVSMVTIDELVSNVKDYKLKEQPVHIAKEEIKNNLSPESLKEFAELKNKKTIIKTKNNN